MGKVVKVTKGEDNVLVPYRVRLPDWVFQNNKAIENRLKNYMQRYPHYSVIDVKGKFAICELKNIRGI